ncbi:MAG: ABC transporter ATP-binding protein [Myxococcota bacterium]|jgi:ABC-2 type transport system ATP-binding protein|nr:ABC transporter ATP-binding protein [Myxococcota bacterium]
METSSIESAKTESAKPEAAKPEATKADADASATSAREVVVSVKDLAKTYRTGFFRKKVEAVRGISFEVRHGEIFGLLGPNGAGKTTTIKCLLRLVFPTRGELKVFRLSPEKRESMLRVGYMPENPYVYRYLKPLELLDLCGRLAGMDRKDRRDRSEAMIDKVGLRHAVDRPIGKFSKGMMQRVGLAQALLHDPELLVLDEPMSGLDPIGRKEIRDILLEQKRRGKTLLFTSHILSDVEMLCDRVSILQKGSVTAEGKLSALLTSEVAHSEIELRGVSSALRSRLAELPEVALHDAEAALLVTVRESEVADALREALDGGARVVAVRPQRKSLEDLFVEKR